jgi:hypothetical protein
MSWGVGYLYASAFQLKRWGNELDGMRALRVNNLIDFKVLWLTKDLQKLGWLIACLRIVGLTLNRSIKELLAENKEWLFRHIKVGVLDFHNITPRH